MLRLRPVLATTMLLMVSAVAFGQMSRLLVTDDPAGGFDQRIDHPASHLLEWWTQDEQKVFKSWNPTGGSPVRQKITTLGILSGHRVIQILTTESSPPDPETLDSHESQMKSLLVQVARSQRYAEIYRLEDASGFFLALRSAAVYGSGQNAILDSFDQFERSCIDNYWWFNASGGHPVDFSPLKRAISQTIPAEGTYYSCWYVHPEKAEWDLAVQSRNRNYTACDFMGEVVAKYRIDRGAAIPVSVRFHAGQMPSAVAK